MVFVSPASARIASVEPSLSTLVAEAVVGAIIEPIQATSTTATSMRVRCTVPNLASRKVSLPGSESHLRFLPVIADLHVSPADADQRPVATICDDKIGAVPL